MSRLVRVHFATKQIHGSMLAAFCIELKLYMCLTMCQFKHPNSVISTKSCHQNWQGIWFGYSPHASPIPVLYHIIGIPGAHIARRFSPVSQLPCLSGTGTTIAPTSRDCLRSKQRRRTSCLAQCWDRWGILAARRVDGFF